MLFINFFLGTCWVAMIGIIWFCTDWFVHYTQLFGCFENTRLKYINFIVKNNNKYFPDFLYEWSLIINNRALKFLMKLASCPFCLFTWLSAVTSLIIGQSVLTAPIYIASLSILLIVKKLM